jgi:DNA-binding transcriptional LysR family regulator
MNLATERLNGIAVFVQVVEAGSFAQAGERLGLSRSAVGKAIARLEDRLGTRLFHRTTRAQSLTDDGQLFHERCVRALAELGEAQAELESGRRAPVGRLRVSMPVLFGRRCVAPVLLELARQHAGLSLELSFDDRPVDLVGEGFDLAVRFGPVPEQGELVARPIGTDVRMLCAAPAYLAAHGRPRRIADLAGHHGLLYARGGMVKPWAFLDARGEVVHAAVQSRVRMDDLQALMDAALAGAGVVGLPVWLAADALRGGALVRVLPREAIAHQPIHLVWPKQRHLPCRMRTAIDLLVERIPPLLKV